MFGHDSEHKKHHDAITGDEHKGHFSHDAIAAAAAYEAMKKYNEHCEKNGKPASHDKAKEIIAAAASGFLTHLVETKGLNYIDRKKAEKQAQEEAAQFLPQP
ncbi:hypothetical protein NP233_g5657 [Leucocoprinus birnbaumii]|uniref:Uncharacterized protein n=1 Tax=Leucocoprinus birnbaumii TaxID=56174 RepID=A0AAD5YUD9_9AGAR|nr:hypothetical protein NP233_g5657 [Leucocoprinus birnbaumii]